MKELFGRGGVATFEFEQHFMELVAATTNRNTRSFSSSQTLTKMTNPKANNLSGFSKYFYRLWLSEKNRCKCSFVSRALQGQSFLVYETLFMSLYTCIQAHNENYDGPFVLQHG